MPEWTKEFNKDLEGFAKRITPEQAYVLSTCYVMAIVKGNEKEQLDFYKTLQKEMDFSNETLQNLLTDSRPTKGTRSGTEVEIMSVLEHETKNAEAKQAIKAIKDGVRAYMSSKKRW